MRPVIAAILTIVLTGCSTAPEPIDPAPRAIKMIEAGHFDGRLMAFTGTIEPFQDVESAFDVSGRIVESLVDEGQLVTAGQVLARLDDRDFIATKQAAEATFARAEADKKRADLLIADEAIARADYDRITNQFIVARADLDAATKALEDTQLRAPFDGRVAAKLVTDLRTVQRSEPIFRIHDVSRLKVVVSLPETLVVSSVDNDLDRLRREVSATVRLTTLPERAIPARIHEVAAVADPSTRTYRATLVIDPPQDINVLPGMTALAEARRKALGDLRVPSLCVQGTEGGEPFVWLVDPEAMSVTQRVVATGAADGGDIIITDGLDIGDLVAASGLLELRAGMQVKRFSMPGDADDVAATTDADAEAPPPAEPETPEAGTP